MLLQASGTMADDAKSEVAKPKHEIKDVMKTAFKGKESLNAKVVAEPETVNEDPYGDGWLLRIRLSDPGEVDALLELDAYEQLLKDS